MKVVGFLGNVSGDPYSLRLMQAVASNIVQAGCHATCFVSGFPSAPLYRDANDQPALPAFVDGWVLLSEKVGVTGAELATIAKRAGPCVSVGLELPETPSLTASDEAGIFQAVAHLARRHERRHIAFVGGPSSSVEAGRRLAAYRLALESVGHKLDPALVASGDFDTRSGREAVRQLQRQAERFDAVVAANDLMAIGVIDGLRADGRRVPEDVSVIGFDDMEEASFSAPTLTTVRQPLQEVGAIATGLLFARLAGEHVQQHTVVTAPLVIRESCGCHPNSDGPDRRSIPPGAEPNRTQGLRENALRDLVRRELANTRLQRELSRMSEGILAAADYSELAPLLTDVCHLLGVRRLMLATYSSAQRHARVTLESSGESVVFHQHTQPHPLEQVLPVGFLRDDRPTHLSIQALELAGEQLGFLVLDGDVRDALGYLELRRSLSSSLARMAQGRELRRLYTAERKRG